MDVFSSFCTSSEKAREVVGFGLVGRNADDDDDDDGSGWKFERI